MNLPALRWWLPWAWLSGLIGGCQPDGVRIACVGDSLTYGAGLENRKADCYPAQLQLLVGEGVHVGEFGVGGRTLLQAGDKPYVAHKVFGRAKRFRPDIVIICLGTNDLKDHNWVHAEQFTKDYDRLITAFQHLPSHPTVYLCLPPPILAGVGHVNNQALQDELHPLVRAVADKNELPLIDWYQPLVGKPDVFLDGLHLNPLGCKIQAEVVARHLSLPNVE